MVLGDNKAGYWRQTSAKYSLIDKVIYSVNNTTYIILYYQYYKHDDMFRFTEPSSGQILKQRKGAFSECAHCGIPYCLQIILTLKIILNSVGRYII